jgi:hypothetical protein
MKKIILVVAIALSGCVVAPRPYYGPEVYVAPQIVYPYREQEYFWDPALGVYFFWANDHYRHLMPRGWRYEHGVPHGYWQGERRR